MSCGSQWEAEGYVEASYPTHPPFYICVLK